MRTVNKITLMGSVGRDPEFHEANGGAPVAHLSLATTRYVPAKEGREAEEITEWHRLTIWGRLATFVRDVVRNGDRLYVEGRMEYGTYERDDVTIPTAEVIVKELLVVATARQA